LGKRQQMAIHKLTTSKVISAKHGMYGDGGGLWLRVTKKGVGKSWVFRWTDRTTKREKVIGLGPVHTVDLHEARSKALACRKLLLKVSDPLAECHTATVAAHDTFDLAKTVYDIVEEYVRAKIAHKSQPHIKQSTRLLGNVLDQIGDMPIQQVTTHTLLDKLGLRAMWTERHPTAVILRSHLKRIFSLAIAQGYYKGKNPAAWVDHLEHILPASRDVHRVKHHPSLPYKDVGRFLRAVRAYEDRSVRRRGHSDVALSLEFVVLTGVRFGEARLARWKQFDIPHMVWNVPHKNTKTGYMKSDDDPPRQIPITPAMLAVIEKMQRRGGCNLWPDAYLFPSPDFSPRGTAPLNKDVLSNFVRRSIKWNIKLTPHGFRSTLVDWARANNYPQYLWDIQLDHVLGNKVGQSYGHDKLIEERRKMMTAWGAYCSTAEPESAASHR
jgi:integrase